MGCLAVNDAQGHMKRRVGPVVAALSGPTVAAATVGPGSPPTDQYVTRQNPSG